MKTVYFRNLDKIREELQDSTQWAAIRWMDDCWKLNNTFVIGEIGRTIKKQRYYWSIGRRGIPGEQKVTWTMNSYHLRGLAIDADPIKKWKNKKEMQSMYDDLEQIANRYGIYRPKALVRKGDLRHFQFEKVEPNRFDPMSLSPEANRKRIHRILARLKEPKKSRLFERAKKRKLL